MEAFDQFVCDRRARLRGIVRATKGEHEFRDVVNEAWLMAGVLSVKRGIPIDFLDVTFQELLLSYLYQHLVRYTDQKVRYATRLDHAPGRDGEADAPHPLLNRLKDAGHDPLSSLVESEEEAAKSLGVDEHYSLASAYLKLLQRFDNRMGDVADHLLISRSHAYRCCGKARRLAVQQHPLPLAPPMTAAALKPWRRYRFQRNPRQLALDLRERLPLAGLDETLRFTVLSAKTDPGADR